MTRRKLRWTQVKFVVFFMVLMLAALLFKASSYPVLNGFYEFMRDMSLILVTMIAAYMAHVFQRRATFLQSLREEWREIVDTKACLVSYLEREQASEDDYLRTYQRISQAIDYMRIVYRNVGETGTKVGYYPYEPLHDMRRALESVDPRRQNPLTYHDRKVAKRKIVEAFYALRERFLEEFDLEEPSRPILKAGSLRKKEKGASHRGERLKVKSHKTDGKMTPKNSKAEKN